MSTKREFAQLGSVSTAPIRTTPRGNRWYGPGISVCLGRFETRAVARKQAVNWDKTLGLVTALVVAALGWTAVGFAVSHLLR
jgi:hypothetical protein